MSNPPKMSVQANEMLKNPAVVALAAAFGLVVIAAIIATIMGIADDMQKRQQSLRK